MQIMEGGEEATFGERLNSAANMGSIRIDSFIPAMRLHPDKPYSDNQRAYIDYAWQISKDPVFLYLLKAENGNISHDRKHPKQVNSTGTDWGFCGTNDYYHPTRKSDPRFFSDWQWQMRECLEMYRGGTTFHGLNRIRRDWRYMQSIKLHFTQ